MAVATEKDANGKIETLGAVSNDAAGHGLPRSGRVRSGLDR